MAKVYKAPFDRPPMDYSGDWMKTEADYCDRLKAFCRERNPGDRYAGTIWKTPMADSYAAYMVLRSKPLEVIHIPLGDAWHASAITMRGLRLSDIKAEAEHSYRESLEGYGAPRKRAAR